MFFLRVILSPLTPVYAAGVKLRNYLFDKGIIRSKKVSAKIISIGNITVGGSGKTPAVIYVTKLLKKFGKRVGVLSRGYGRNSKGYVLVADKEGIKSSVEICGDEIYLTAIECGVPAAVCEKRVEGAEKFLQDVDLDVIVLDDAFQHRWIKRDINILIFDQNFLNKIGGMDQNLLPLGMMRESFRSIKRADAVIVNRKFSEISHIPLPLKKHFQNTKIFTAYYKAAGFYDVKNKQFYKLEDFKGQKSLVVSGIARPQSFLRVLEQNQIDTKDKLIFKDHQNYTSEEIQQIRKTFYGKNSHSVITTEKDAVKLMRFSKELDDIDIYYLKIEMELDSENEFENFIFNKI